MFNIELWLAGDSDGIAVSLFTPNWTLCADTFLRKTATIT